MENVSRTNHLMRRNGVYYYRRRIPTDLIAVFGKREIQRSLGTTKAKEAEKLAAVEDLKWHEQFAAAVDLLAGNGSPPPTVAGPPLSEAEAIGLVQEYVECTDERVRRRLTADPPISEKQKAEMIADAETGAQIVRHRDDPRADELIYAASQKILLEASRSADAPELPYTQFAELVRRALIELDRRKLSRLQDACGPGFFDDLFNPSRKPSTPFGTLAGQFLDELEEDARANKTNQKWIDKRRTNVALALQLIGPDTPVQSIGYDECQQFRRTLARIPSNRTKIFPDLSIAEQIERAELEGRPLLSTETQKGYLGALRNVLDLAAKKHLIAVNPAEGLTPLVRERLSSAERRLSFTAEQLKYIFESGFYRDAARHAYPWQNAEPTWRFWLPLLCLFMGLRPNEACQAYVGDLRCTAQGTWYLDIAATTDDDGKSVATGKTLKTASSRRRVPVHPEIIAMGFIKFVEARAKRDATGRLFPELKPDKYGNLASYALKRFRDDFLPACVELSARQSFYSFRHNFRDALRRIDAPPDALQGLGGWSQGKRVSDSYGDRSDPDYLVQFISRIGYPGIDLSFLRPREEN